MRRPWSVRPQETIIATDPLPRTPPRARNRGVWWVALGAGVSGFATYVLLAAVARGLDDAAFDGFSLYWAMLIVVSVGCYLPIEQIVARRTAIAGASGAAGGGPEASTGDPASDGAVLRWWATRWGLATAVVGTGGLLAVAAATSSAHRLTASAVLVFALNLAAVTGQCIVRGVAAGRDRLDVYAAVTVCDAVLRTGACVVAAIVGAATISWFALAIAAGCWASVGLGAVMLTRPSSDRLSNLPRGQVAPRRGTTGLSAEARALVPAMVAMQLLLNSPVVIAFLTSDDGARAGIVLAVASLARASVFVAQAAQAAYVARIAGLVASGSPRAAGLVRLVAALAVTLAALTAVVAGLLGPWATRTLFGDTFVVSHGLCLAVGAGIAVFLVAIVTNDLLVARGLHAGVGRYWIAGLVVACGCAVTLPPGDARTLAPIAAGSGVALLLSLALSRRRGVA